MAAELEDNLEADTELFAEGGGIFDVVVDGKLIYSKFSTGRFPEKNEVTELINASDV